MCLARYHTSVVEVSAQAIQPIRHTLRNPWCSIALPRNCHRQSEPILRLSSYEDRVGHLVCRIIRLFALTNRGQSRSEDDPLVLFFLLLTYGDYSSHSLWCSERTMSGKGCESSCAPALPGCRSGRSFRTEAFSLPRPLRVGLWGLILILLLPPS